MIGSRVGWKGYGMAWYWNGCVWYDGVMVLGSGFSYPEIEIMIGFEHDLLLLLLICDWGSVKSRDGLIGENRSEGLQSCPV